MKLENQNRVGYITQRLFNIENEMLELKSVGSFQRLNIIKEKYIFKKVYLGKTEFEIRDIKITNYIVSELIESLNKEKENLIKELETL
jgi:hypothetical protein